MPPNSKRFPRLTLPLLLGATVCAMAQTAPLPQIRQNGAVKQFFVDSSKDEGKSEKGTWVPGRRLNGDEAGTGLPNGKIGMLKIKLVRFD